jgi:hypothetical protein
VLPEVGRESSYDAEMLAGIYSAVLVAAFLAIAIAAGYFVYRAFTEAR